VIYSYARSGALTHVASVPNPMSGAACWTLINRAAARLYTVNTLTSNLSVFDIGADPRSPRQIQVAPLSLRLERGTPTEFALDPEERLLWVSNPRNLASFPGMPPIEFPASHPASLHTFSVAADGRLTELPTSPMRLPVPPETNVEGFVVL
jgi:hypothetical protein